MDHARVVDLLRKADHLPLIKEYLLAVQKTNLGAVNEAVRPELADDWEKRAPSSSTVPVSTDIIQSDRITSFARCFWHRAKTGWPVLVSNVQCLALHCMLDKCWRGLFLHMLS